MYDLAAAICAAVNFDFDHAFGFYSTLTSRYFDSPEIYELFVDIGESVGEGAKSVKRTKVAKAFPKVGKKMLFVFDYGDE